MPKLSSVIEACNLLNEINVKLAEMLECPVELRLVEPYIGGLYVSDAVLDKLRADHLKSAIVQVVCNHFMVSLVGLRSKQRTRELVEARWLCALLLYQYVDGVTDGEIAKELNVERSTALAERKNAEVQIRIDRDLKFKHEQILKQLRERVDTRD